jgi:dolichol-phosphate mannosyltransferase
MDKKHISIIIPVYNEADNIAELVRRLDETISRLDDRVNIIFVDDGSGDETVPVIRRQIAEKGYIRLIVLTRNFGNQAAISAALNDCRSDAAIIMDADLQDPPELIPDLIQKWQEGYEIVYARRVKRKGESLFKRMTAAIFYRMLQRLTHVSIPRDTGDFRLIDREVVKVLNSMPERNRFLRGMVSWTGFRQTGVDYERDRRFAGQTKFPFFRMIRFAVTGITSFSFLPLQLASYFGFFVSGIAFLSALYVLYLKFLTDRTVQGWTSMMIALLFLGGIQLITLGIIGEYLGRMSDEVKQRPAYLIREKVNFSGDEDL